MLRRRGISSPLLLLLSRLLSISRLPCPLSASFSCSAPWPDACPPEGIPGDAACTPFAAPLPPGADLLAVRARLSAALFGLGGALPPGGADAVLPLPGGSTPANRGCWCSTLGNCNASACAWPSAAQRVVFTVRAPFANGSSLVLNSTAFWTLNTSGVAPSTYIGELGPPAFPVAPVAPARGATLVIWHQGHNAPCLIPGGDADYDGIVDHLNQLGFDVLNLHMPAYQVNAVPPLFVCDHAAFAPLEALGVPVFRFFLEPIVRAVTWAIEEAGYRRVALAGLSGGGWSTTLAAALDARVALSVPIAGSVPCDMRHTSWDYEQLCNRSWAMVANYTNLYALAALEANRTSVQILHEQDPCCFHGCGRHARIREYNGYVAGVAGGNFRTAVTAGNVHEVNPRDRAILAGLLHRLDRAGSLDADDVRRIPFNLLDED